MAVELIKKHIWITENIDFKLDYAFALILQDANTLSYKYFAPNKNNTLFDKFPDFIKSGYSNTSKNKK